VTACNTYTWTYWEGNTYTTSGSYDYITTTASGCRDTVTLDLTIGTGTHTHVPLTACGSYTWTTGNGNTYTASGSYDYITTNATGCQDTVTLDLTINRELNRRYVVHDPAPVCAPGTVDLTDPNITAGSDNGLTYTYWMDAANTIPLQIQMQLDKAVLIYHGNCSWRMFVYQVRAGKC
jgi:hypothetical protein